MSLTFGPMLDPRAPGSQRAAGAAGGVGGRRLLVLGAVAVLAGVAVLGVLVVSSPSGFPSDLEIGGKVPVTAMHQGLGLAHNSPMLAVDPTAPGFVVAADRVDAPRFSCGLEVSGSHGAGWQPVDPVGELPDGAQTCYAPEVVFGPQGRLHYLFAGLAGRGNEPVGLFLTSSDDRGQTFTASRKVLGEHNFSVRMGMDRTVGGRGRMYLSWLHANSDPPLGAMPAGANPIRLAASSDGGVSWSDPVQVNPPAHQRVAGTAMTVARDGTVYVAYFDLQDDLRDYKGLAGPTYGGTWSLVVARSTDGGRSFETAVVDDAVGPVERVMLIFTMAPPALAAGPDGHVCVGWPQAHAGHGDVVVACSTDRGAKWAVPQRVNPDPGDSSAVHVLPQLAFAPNGRLDALFLARNPTNGIQHTYYAGSLDGGATFADAVRVTSQASDIGIGQRYVGPAAEGQVEFGSRLGLLAGNRQTVAMWPDTSNSRVGTTGQDLFAATLTSPPTDDWPLVGWVGSGLLVAGLAGGGVGLVRRRRTHVWAGEGLTEPDTDDPVVDGASPRGWLRRTVQGVAVVAVVVVAAVVGWQVVDGPAARLPSDPPTVRVVLDENGLAQAGPVAPGRVVFEVANRGHQVHRLTVWPMGEQEPPIDELLTNDRVEIRAPFARIAPVAPGQTTAFAVNLAAGGRYALADVATDPDDPQGRTFAQLGSSREFRVGPVPVGSGSQAVGPVGVDSRDGRTRAVSGAGR